MAEHGVHVVPHASGATSPEVVNILRDVLQREGLDGTVLRIQQADLRRGFGLQIENELKSRSSCTSNSD